MHRVKRLSDQLSPNAQRATRGGCACFAARKQARLLTRLYDTALSSHGLTSGQFSMLAALAAGNGAMTVQTLADAMGTDHSTTSRGLAPLAKRGYLSEGRDEGDGRKRILHFTERGLRKFNQAAEAWAEAQVASTHLQEPQG